MKKVDELRKKIGQLFQLGLNGTALSGEQKRLFGEYPPGALRITPFIKKFIPQKEGEPAPRISNIELARLYEKVSALIHDACGSPPIIRDGMEGGEWNCLIQDRFPVAPMLMGYANHNDPGLSYRAFSQLARAESAVGLRCSDVLVDLNFDRRNDAMNNRTLGAGMAVIVDQARAMTSALRDNGVIPVLKHFPCQSWGSTDTHFDVMRVPLSVEEMEKSVFPPYRELLDNTMAVMLSHATFTAVDGKLPTTLSPAVVTGLLRERLGFDGLVMTDSITMASILDHYPIPEACVATLKAGADQVLLKAEDYFADSIRAVEAAVKSGEISEARLDKSYKRIMSLKAHYGITSPFVASEARIESALHSPQAQAFWSETGRALTRVLRHSGQDLPLKPAKGEKWLVIEQDEHRLAVSCADPWHHASILGNALEERFREVSVEKRHVPYSEKAGEGAAHIAGAEGFDRVFVGAYSTRIRPCPFGVSRALGEKGVPHIAVTNNPFNADPGRLSDKARTVVCPFGFFRFPILGAVAMLAGDVPADSNVRPDLALNGADAWQSK